MMKHLLILVGCLLALTACSNDENDGGNELEAARRTVVVYMSAENSLSGNVQIDIDEMIEGAKKMPANDNLMVFVDRAKQQEKPFIARITQDAKNPVDTLLTYDSDITASDPDRFFEVLNWIVTNYPATHDYGLVLWGHAGGWIIEQNSATASKAPRRAYGIDNGKNDLSDNGLWLNIPDMRQALEQLPVRWKFILCDCCNMQNIEIAYELRQLTEYLIGAPSEIPANGAPYSTIVPDMFLTSETFYQNIVDDYADSYNSRLPLSVIRTAQTPALAQATAPLLTQVCSNLETYGTDRLIYYYAMQNCRYRLMFDMNDVVRRVLADDANAYQTWRNAFDQAVVYKRIATKWATNSTIKIQFDFNVSDDNFGGVSMFIPLNDYATEGHRLNEKIKQMQWYQAVGWPSAGW